MSGAPHCTHTNGRPGGWLLLPVAPRSNARSRHGGQGVSTPCACGQPPASPALLPDEALEYLRTVMESGAAVHTVGIAGPGDPFAVPDRTLETLRLVRAAYPHITLCVTTNGLGVAGHAAALADLGVNHVTLLMDAVDPELVDTLYAWIRPGTRTLRPGEGAALLVDEQAVALAALAGAGIEMAVCVTVYPGINDAHVGDIAAAAKALGASGIHVLPFVPAGDAAGPVPAADAATMDAARRAAAVHLPVLDASARDGLSVARRTGMGCGEPVPVTSGSGLPVPGGDRPYVAVASSDGFDVDEHLGHARQFLVYGPTGVPPDNPMDNSPDSPMGGPVGLLGVRPAPPAGSGDARWEALAAVLSDCAYLLVSSAGQRPVDCLAARGLRVIQTEDNIEGLVDVLYGGGKKGRNRGTGRTVQALQGRERTMPKPTHQILVCQSFRHKGEPKGVCFKQTDGFLQYLEEEILDRGLDILVTATGCLKACEEGPVLVVQPQNWWFKGVDSHDAIDAILDGIEDGEPNAEYLMY